jgi:hypothetical protein
MGVRRVQYFIPTVGAVQAEFFAESAALLVHLEDRGEIQRVQRLRQLGLVELAWPMARHTRWDFTMLLLDLARRTKDLPRIHVGSPVRLTSQVQISSGRELLSCWAMLLNLGHLHGTFATEGELLYSVKCSGDQAQHLAEIASTIPEGPGQAWFASLVARERTYQFYQALSFYRLDRIGAGHPELGTWQAILLAYVVPRPDESPALAKMRSLFQRLRRLAFLALDASVTPSPLAVRLVELGSAPEALERLLTTEPGTAADDELASLEAYLNRDVYNGREVLRVLSTARKRIRRKLEAGLGTNGLRYVVESAAAEGPQFAPPSRTQARDVVRGYFGGPPLQLLTQARDFTVLRRRYEEAFDRWSQLLGSKVSLQVAQSAAGSQIIFQTHVHRHTAPDYASAISGSVMLAERFRKKFGNPFFELELGQYLVRGASQGILVAALQHFFPLADSWEFEPPAGPFTCVIGSRATVLKAVHEASERSSLKRARRHELQVLEQRVRTTQCHLFVVSLASVVAYGPDRVTQVAELDGVIVGVDNRRGDLVLTTVEAKYMNGAENRSRGQLRDTLQELGNRPGIRQSRMSSSSVGRRGHAWVTRRSRYART